MAKKQTTNAGKAADSTPKVAVEVPTAPTAETKWSIYDFKVQAIIIAIISFVLYFNSFFNEVAHDDGIVIVKNEYVQKGFAGIGDILTKDAYDSYYRQLNTTNQLNGGRYRPLSIVTFAIEQQFMGTIANDKLDSVLKQNIATGIRGAAEQRLIKEMHIRHVINVLWYIVSLVVLLYFLRYIVFRQDPLIAFIATLIFAIHPIHTEVVANVKSRDEIMSLLFMSLTFILHFKYLELKNIKYLFGALGCFFLAFLSKEYAITMVVLLPLSMYTFNKMSLPKSIISFLPYGAVILAYLAIRLQIVAPMGENSDTEVLNNPYIFASATDKLATEISTSLNYLKLLIFPHPLSADYSFDSIPYQSFGSPIVWLSLLVHAGLVVGMIIGFMKRNFFSFAIAFYLLHLALVCNIFFDIGATMGERLIFHSSVGFAIALAYLLVKGFERIKPVENGHKALAGFMVVILLLSGYKTISRNAEWKNDGTLFEADLKVVPNSVLVCANVAASYITKADYQSTDTAKHEYLYKAIKLLDHALTIHPNMVASYINRGIGWYKLGNMEKAKANLDSAKVRYPTYPTLPGIYKLIGDDYMNKGWSAYGQKGMYVEAIAEFKKGLAADSSNADLWYNLGGAYYSNRQFAEAVNAWNVSLKIKPGNVKAMQGLQAAMNNLNAMSGRPQPQK